MFGMLVATEIWICVYYVFSLWIDNTKFSFFFLLRQMLFFRGASCPHLWYMPVILGLYIFLPFIANALNKIDGRILMYPVLLVVLYLFITPIINIFLECCHCFFVAGVLCLNKKVGNILFNFK